MKTPPILLLITMLVSTQYVFCQTPNPFSSIHKKGKVYTAYDDRVVEFFDYDSIQRIGSVIINIKTGKIVKLLDAKKVFKLYTDNSAASRWYSPDPMSYMYFHYSPYAYVGGNPIRYIDPDGKLIMGYRKSDIKKFLSDLNVLLDGDAFKQLRELLKISKNQLATIDQDAFDKATEGLKGDKKAFATTVFNTINDEKKHVVEYDDIDGDVSEEGSKYIKEQWKTNAFDATLAANGNKFKASYIALMEAVTAHTEDGSWSVMIVGANNSARDYKNKTTGEKGPNPVGPALDAGHEVFGHGRYMATSEPETGQNANAIRMENLILRAMGKDNIQRTGENHNGGIVPDESKMPVL